MQRLNFKNKIRGIVFRNDTLFVVQQTSTQIEIFDLKTCQTQGSKEFEGLENPWDMVEMSGIFYISEQSKPVIHQYIEDEALVHKWDAEGSSATLSTTPEGNLLVSYAAKNRSSSLSSSASSSLSSASILSSVGNVIIEYCTKTRNQIRIVGLDSLLITPAHAIRLFTGEFIVCDILGDQHRIVKLDVSEAGIREYGRPVKLDIKPIKMPQYLIGTGTGFILVADQNNGRIVMLNYNLELIKELGWPEHKLENPFRMCLDKKGGRLFVAEKTQNRLNIFHFVSNA